MGLERYFSGRHEFVTEGVAYSKYVYSEDMRSSMILCDVLGNKKGWLDHHPFSIEFIIL
jgi:hypothetical protein